MIARKEGRERKRELEAAREEAARARQSVQDVLPLRDIRDGVLYLSDGSFRIYVEYPSRNYSIYSPDQKAAEARANAAALSAISTTYAILKYPKTVSSQAQLVLIDRAIADARKRAYAGGGAPAAGALNRLKLLEERVRPQAQTLAAKGDRIEWTSVIAFCFDADRNVDEARRQIDSFSRIAEAKTKLRPVPLSTSQILELLELWLTPTRVGADKPVYVRVPLPKGYGE